MPTLFSRFASSSFITTVSQRVQHHSRQQQQQFHSNFPPNQSINRRETSSTMPSSFQDQDFSTQSSNMTLDSQRTMSDYGMEHFTFLTSSFKKLAEVKHILGEDFPVEVRHSSLDIEEYQGEPDFIVREKCKLAAQHVYPVLVEDTCVL